MSPPTLAGRLPGSLVRRWRSLRLRLRSRVGLALLAVSVVVVAWTFTRERPDDWPARMVLTLPAKNWPMTFEPDGRTFLSAGASGLVPWDLATGRMGSPWQTKKGIFLRKGAYSPDGRAFAVANSQHPNMASIELIDPDTGRITATLTTRHQLVRHLAFADDGRTLRAFLGDSGFLKEAVTWDVATGQQTSSRTLTVPDRGSGTAFLPDGRVLAFVPFPSTAVQLWDLEADASLGTLTNPARPLSVLGYGVDYSSDGRTLAVSNQDGAVDLWDVPARRLIKTLQIHPKGYSSMALRLSPDGRTLASSGGELSASTTIGRAVDHVNQVVLGKPRRGPSEMVVVDLATGRRLVKFPSSHYPIYSPDGRTLATTGNDLVVHLRDLPGL